MTTPLLTPTTPLDPIPVHANARTSQGSIGRRQAALIAGIGYVVSSGSRCAVVDRVCVGVDVDVCMAVGFSSLGSFSRTFTDIVGQCPSEFRGRADVLDAVPSCFVKTWTRPASFGEAT